MERWIWTMWWQGEESAPLPVKLCLASIRRNANGAEVVVLDRDTYRQYVTVPERILYRLPDNVTYVQAAMIEPLSIAYHAATRKKAKRDSAVGRGKAKPSPSRSRGAKKAARTRARKSSRK